MINNKSSDVEISTLTISNILLITVSAILFTLSTFLKVLLIEFSTNSVKEETLIFAILILSLFSISLIKLFIFVTISE